MTLRRKLLLAQGKGFARTSFGFRHQRLKRRVGGQQLIHQGVVFLRLQRLNRQESLIRHLDNDCLTGFGAFIQRLNQIRLQPA